MEIDKNQEEQRKETQSEGEEERTTQEGDPRCDPPFSPHSPSTSSPLCMPLHISPCTFINDVNTLPSLSLSFSHVPSLCCGDQEENMGNSSNDSNAQVGQVGESLHASRATLRRKNISKAAFGRQNRGLEPTPLDPTSPIGPPTMGGDLDEENTPKRSYKPGARTPGAPPLPAREGTTGVEQLIPLRTWVSQRKYNPEKVECRCQPRP